MITKEIAINILQKHINLRFNHIQNKKDIFEYFMHKINHSYNVVGAIQRIIFNDKKLNQLSEEIKQIAIISATLHDIARFYQINNGEVLSGSIFEHGNAGYDILKNEGITDNRILLSIKYHNKVDIKGLYNEQDYVNSPHKEKEEIEIITKMVRDADKLENLECLVFNDFTISLNKYSLNKPSEKVIDTFLKQEIFSFKEINSNSDYLLYHLSRLFDINCLGTTSIINSYNFKELVISKLERLGVINEQIEKIRLILN